MYNHKQPNNTTTTGNSQLPAAGVGLEGWYGVARAPLNICDYPVLLEIVKCSLSLPGNHPVLAIGYGCHH